MVQPSIVNGTELGTQECQDFIFLQYGLELTDIPHYCDGCNATFSIINYLDCKWGGLVTSRHNKLRDGVVDLSGKSFTPSHMRDGLLIFAGFSVKRTKAKPDSTKATTVPANTPPLEATEHKGDRLIRDL